MCRAEVAGTAGGARLVREIAEKAVGVAKSSGRPVVLVDGDVYRYLVEQLSRDRRWSGRSEIGKRASNMRAAGLVEKAKQLTVAGRKQRVLAAGLTQKQIDDANTGWVELQVFHHLARSLMPM